MCAAASTTDTRDQQPTEGKPVRAVGLPKQPDPRRPSISSLRPSHHGPMVPELLGLVRPPPGDPGVTEGTGGVRGRRGGLMIFPLLLPDRRTLGSMAAACRCISSCLSRNSFSA